MHILSNLRYFKQLIKKHNTFNLGFITRDRESLFELEGLCYIYFWFD